MSDAESIEMFRDSAQDFLGRADQLKRLRKLRSASPAFDRAIWQQIAELGWLSILVPEEQGGLGLGLREVAAIARRSAAACCPSPSSTPACTRCALCRVPESGLRDTLLGASRRGARSPESRGRSSAGSSSRRRSLRRRRRKASRS